MSAATHDVNLELDERDREIFSERFNRLQDQHGPRVGDYIRYSCGTVRRIAFVTPVEWLPEVDSVQGTWLQRDRDYPEDATGGSFYLADGYCKHSGGLVPGVKRQTLSYSREHRPGAVWFFHHDYFAAGNGVTAVIDFRVYDCTEPLPA